MTDLEYYKSDIFSKKYEMALKRLEILPRLNLSQQFKERTTRNMANWVFNKRSKIKECPLSEGWWTGEAQYKCYTVKHTK